MQNIDDAYSRFQKTSTFIKVHVCNYQVQNLCILHVSQQACSAVPVGLTILRIHFHARSAICS